jgi:hypothetical protein
VLLLDFFDLRPGLETPLEIPGILGRLIGIRCRYRQPALYLLQAHHEPRHDLERIFTGARSAQGGGAMIMMLAVDNSELLDPRNLIQRSPEWRAERCGKATIERDRVLRTFVRDRLSRKGGKEQDWKSYGLAMLTFSLAGSVCRRFFPSIRSISTRSPRSRF